MIVVPNDIARDFLKDRNGKKLSGAPEKPELPKAPEHPVQRNSCIENMKKPGLRLKAVFSEQTAHAEKIASYKTDMQTYEAAEQSLSREKNTLSVLTEAFDRARAKGQHISVKIAHDTFETTIVEHGNDNQPAPKDWHLSPLLW